MARPEAQFDRTGAALVPVATGENNLAEVIDRAFEEAVAGAIAGHKAAGRPIYYSDPAYPGYGVKELADGRRFLITRDENLNQVEIREIPQRRGDIPPR